MRQLIQTDLLTDRHLRQVRGVELLARYPQLAQLLQGQLSPGDLRILAEPELAEGEVRWHTPEAGEIRPFSKLSLTEQGTLLTTLSAFKDKLASLSQRLSATDDPNSQLAGGLLNLLVEDVGASEVYLVGTQPVLAGWGLAPGPAPVAAPLPQAVPVAAVRPPSAVFPAGLGLVLGLLLSTGLTVALFYFLWPDLWLIMKGRPPLPTIDQAGFDQDQDQVRRLRLDLASLKEQYAAKKKSCQPPEPPKEEPPKVEPPKEEPAEPPKEKPKPEKPKPEKPKEKPKPKSDNLEIPEGAAQRNDLSFLEGCWRSVTGIRNNDGASIITIYCFDKKGRGTSKTVELGRDGKPLQTCSSRAWAVFKGSQLSIQEDPNLCPDGRKYSPTVIECRQTGSAASCQGTNLQNGRPGTRWKATLKRQR